MGMGVGRILMGMRKNKEVDGRKGHLKADCLDQGKLRVRLDCDKHVLVSANKYQRGTKKST